MFGISYLYASDKNNLYEIDLFAKTVGMLKDHQVSIDAMDFDLYTEKNSQAASTLVFTDISAVTSVKGFTGIPTKYDLLQNYPNPFNPVTTIKYHLPSDGLVTLKIFDALGKEITTLVNETKSAGRYEVQFNASNLASGIYFYQINVNDFSSTKKLILMK